MTDQAHLVATMHELADIAGTVILPHFRNLQQVDDKSSDGHPFDPVTVADTEAEWAIREHLAAHWPDHAVVGEELPPEDGNAAGSAPYRWIIDPIDGTRGFVCGFPIWGTLIGLEHDDAPLMGLMNQPFTQERFWSDGQSSYFRHAGGATTPLSTRSVPLQEARLSTTSPDLFTDGEERRVFDTLNARVRDRRYGGDCYAYCLLAAGHIDLVVEAGLKPYDIAALIPIVRDAGGQITNWQGGSALDGGRILATGNAALHDDALRLIATVT